MSHVVRDKEKLIRRVRRLRGQVEAVEKAIEAEADCSTILHTTAACRGAIEALMAELIEGHIRYHVLDPDHNPASERAKATQEVIDIVKSYLR